MSNETINTLRFWADTYNTVGFVERDPVQFPRRYTGVSAEISGFITAWISFGNRKAIVEKAEYLNSCLVDVRIYLYLIGFSSPLSLWMQRSTGCCLIVISMSFVIAFTICIKILMVWRI